ncbi:MAG: NYN domain-containing protein [Rhodopirellula sp.]|nr:NYN domain-containing protein [Rhodopirellula sp.]
MPSPYAVEILVQTASVAIYIDLENLPGVVDVGLLLKGLGDGEPGCIHAVRSAYGAASHISAALRQRLTEHSVRIIDTPHVSGKKNRADLMISIDAFERLHVNVPPVDRYVFISSDSDFSVIMDRLRSYGKQVWMVCRKSERHKLLFLNSCDKLLFIENFVPVPHVDPRMAAARHRAVEVLKETLVQIGRNGLPISLAVLGARMRSLHANFTVRGSGFKTLSALVRHCEADNLLRMGCDEKGSRQIEDFDDSRLAPPPTMTPPPTAAAANPARRVKMNGTPGVKLLWPLEEVSSDEQDNSLTQCRVGG